MTEHAIVEACTLPQLLRAAAAAYGDDPAVKAEDGATLSFAALERRSADLARGLIARGAAASVVRRRLLFGSLGLAALGIILIPLTHGLATLIVALVITATGFGPVTVVLYTAGQTLAGPGSAGRWVGIQSSVGNLAGIIGPVITGLIVDAVGYEPAFALAAAVPLVGGLVFALGVPRIAPVAWRTAGSANTASPAG